MKSTVFATILLKILWTQGTLAIREGPRLLQEPPPVKTFPNEHGVTLSCVAAATPPPTITWVTADGAQAESVGSLRLVSGTHGNVTLTLLPFRPDQYRHDIHAATYRCLATNSVGTVTSRPVTVTAVVMQRFEVGVSDAAGVVGGPAVFTCDVPPTVSRHVTVTSWTVDGRTITSAPRPDGRHWVLPTGELVIQNITPTDAYTRVSCTASHAFDPTPRTSNVARVIVTGEPRLSRPQLLLRRDIARPWAREDILFPCIARGHPLPTVAWYKDDETHGRVSLSSGNTNGRVQVINGQLFISSLREEDKGHYLCIANNSAGTDSYRVDILVREHLSVTVEPSLQRVDLGRPTKLTCRVSGSPVNSVTWYKDGRPLPPLPRVTSYDKSLHITQISREDGGMYQCLAKNDEDSSQGAAQLDLGDSAPELEYRFISQTLQPGPSVSLKCIASGAPTPHVSWTLDGFPLPQHDRLVVGQYVGMGGSVVSHVNLTGVRSEDGGAYTCIAANRAGSVLHTARLNVYGPAYVRPMSIVTAVAGEQLFIACPAAGYPLEQITWTRDGRTLPVSVRQEVFQNGTLVVRSVQKTADAGEYTCTAQDKQGRTHSATATVQVLVPPKLGSFLFGRDLTLGERVSVQCTVNSGDTPLQISWTKDGAPVEGVSGAQVRMIDQYTSVLTIERLAPVHAGNFTCTAKNDASSVRVTAPLHVNVPPSWLEAPRDTSITLGGTVHIPCHAQGFPTPKVSWRRTRENQPGQYTPILGSGMGVGVGVASNGSLLIIGARAEDEGQYLCEASNGVGGGLSALIKLTVNAPPRFDPGLQQKVSVRRGSRASLLCHAHGDPPITLIWQASHVHSLDNSVVHEVPGGVRGELVIPSVKMEDAGEYSCTASNAYGRDAYVITLIVQDVPGSPHGLRVSERGSRYLVVSWLPPATSHTSVDKYIVQYTQTTGSWGEGEEEVIAGNNHSARLAPLLPDTQYLVRLLAANHLGSSPHSEPLQVRTEGEAPSAAPMSVRADAVSSGSIRVLWEPPPPHTHHGDLLGYNLGVRRHDVVGEESYNFTVVGLGAGSTGLQEVITELSPWTQYTVVIRAYNTHGPGPLSQPEVVRTMEDVPSGPPIGVECSGGARGTSLIVRWAPPPPSALNGLLQGYRLTLTRLDDTTDKVEELTRVTNGREENVGGLRPWTNYTVSVAATTRAGAGVASQDLTCTTKEDIAGAPKGLRALQSGLSSALLSWLPPHPSTGLLLGYTLFHRPPLSRSTSEISLHAHDNSHTINHLSRGIHEFWMTARTRVGEGPPTTTVKLTIKDTVSPGISSVGGLVVATQGEDVRLACVTVGNPLSPLIWSLRGIQLQNNGRFRHEDNGALVIRGVQRGDRGNYTCSISAVRKHLYLHTSATYSLHVQVPPSAPSVHIADATSSSLTVAWTPGDTGGAAVRAWAVWWREALGGGSWHTRELGRTHTSYVITDLSCGAEYQVYVTARTHVGLSPPSRPLTARTSGSAPVAPPTRHVASVNSTGVWVWLGRWADGGCPITHFTLQTRSPSHSVWTTLASSLAPQEVYEVGGLRPGATFGLRLTAHNAAGATTTTFNANTASGAGLGAQPVGELGDAPPNHMHTDPRLLASAAASALALVLTVAAAVLCLRRRAAAGRGSHMSQEDQEAEENKTNLLHQRDAYYATVRKPQPVPATLERIPGTWEKATEYSEDIYPYATFQLGEGRSAQDDTATAKFQTFVFQDSRYGVTESHPPTSPSRPTPIKAHGRSRSHGRGVGGPRSESEEYDSLQSDTDTEHATSSRTESSIHLDSATLENHASLHLPLDPHLATLEGRADPLASHRSGGARNVHHNLIYHAPESSTSTEPSPICERKSFPRKAEINKIGRCGVLANRGLGKMVANIRGQTPTQETALSIPKKIPAAAVAVTIAAAPPPPPASAMGNPKASTDDGKYGFTRRITPPVGFSSGSHNELSEAECDLEIRNRNKEVAKAASGAILGHGRSQFRSYAAEKDNKDYSIKV
ncbi:cell adhesion molecule Dscam2-like isoform X2 [Macrobrachium nipponense]|uniref:cell adhesion molecule Dscam2-like isoform X2 n=1 Tax=Macrobrachium nipponense TaxID=159736 RepID=UPI0030C8813B